MSYIRPVRLEELVAWLVENEYVNALEATALAAALIERYDVITEASTPQ